MTLRLFLVLLGSIQCVNLIYALCIIYHGMSCNKNKIILASTLLLRQTAAGSPGMYALRACMLRSQCLEWNE